jgi:hypothetical protein
VDTGGAVNGVPLVIVVSLRVLVDANVRRFITTRSG